MELKSIRLIVQCCIRKDTNLVSLIKQKNTRFCYYLLNSDLSYPLCLSSNLFIPIYLSIYLSLLINIYLSSFVDIYLSFVHMYTCFLLKFVHIYLSIYLSIICTHVHICLLLQFVHIYLSIYLYTHTHISPTPVCSYLSINPYLPTPLLGQDMTQGQFLSGV